MVYYSLNKGELYMKHLLILLCMSTLVSCGIKDKYFNSTGGTLGVPKQPVPHTTPQVITQPSTQNSQTHIVDDSDATATSATEESTLKWYYSLPFIGLVILVFLVYRLKKQNLNSL